MEDSDCISFSGAGTLDNPFQAAPILDPDTDNLTECGASGLLTQLPSLYKSPPRAKIFRSVTQTIPGPLIQQFIEFNGYEYDSAGMWDPGTDAFRLTIPADGLYDFRAMIAIGDANYDILYLLEGVKNAISTVAYDKHEVNNVPNIGTRLQFARDIELNANDYLGLRVEHGGSTDQNLIVDGSLGVYMSVRWVAPLVV